MSDIWKEIRTITDEAEHVTKFVFTAEDAVVEAVLYRYPDYQTRTVICCSVQSGCPIGCRFCGTGDYFVRSLKAHEIYDQVAHCIEHTGLRSVEIERLQIMFMSMGEPMLNQRELFEAAQAMHMEWPHAALLISTSAPDVNYDALLWHSSRIDAIGLQFSIHESTDEARNRLIPFDRKLTLEQIAALGRRWAAVTGRNPFFNYCAHEGNTSTEDVERLVALFDPTIFQATVSVICERDEGREATNAHQRTLALEFGQKLLQAGYNVRVFDPAGQDTIGGGCGQLWFVQEWMKKNHDKARPSRGHGLPVLHTPGGCNSCSP